MSKANECMVEVMISRIEKTPWEVEHSCRSALGHIVFPDLYHSISGIVVSG